MDTIEKVYSEERVFEKTKFPIRLGGEMKRLAGVFFPDTSGIYARPEYRAWSNAASLERRSIKPGEVPVYDAYLIEDRDIKFQAKNGGIVHDEPPVEKDVHQHSDKLAEFKAMTKAELMLYLRDDGITHTMTAMRKMTKAKLETIAFMRSVVIPGDDEA